MEKWFDKSLSRENLHSSYDFRRKSKGWNIIFWLLLIAAGIYAYVKLFR
jgi:hypothetical protein